MPDRTHRSFPPFATLLPAAMLASVMAILSGGEAQSQTPPTPPPATQASTPQAATPQAATPQALAQQPVAVQPAPAPPAQENPGLINEIGKLLHKVPSPG